MGVTTEQLKEWQALCDSATKGRRRGGTQNGPLVFNDDGSIIMDASCGFDCEHDRQEWEADAAFDVAARTAMPALIAEVKRLTANNQMLSEVANHNHRACQKVEAQVEALQSGWPEAHRPMCPGPDYCDCSPQERRDARDAQIAAALAPIGKADGQQ